MTQQSAATPADVTPSDLTVSDDAAAEQPATEAPSANGEVDHGSSEPSAADDTADVAADDTADGSADVADDDAAADDDSADDGDSADTSDGGEDEGSSDPLELEGEIAADYLEDLLDITDLDGDIDTYVESGRAHVSVVTESDELVGPDGTVLDALQELARLAVVTRTGGRSRLMLDVAGHRDRRRKELTELATDAIEEAKSTKESVRLAPMNPFERKIVHDAVADAGLTSESEGEEPRRRVVVIP